MLKLKNVVTNEHGKFSIEYVLGIFVVMIGVFAIWRLWCISLINIINPFFFSIGNFRISTQHCRIKLNISVEDIQAWFKNLLPQFNIQPLPSWAIKSAVIVMAIILIAVILTQIQKKRDAIKNEIQYWYSLILPSWLLRQKSLRLDAAVPDKVELYGTFLLAVAIRQLDSPEFKKDKLSVVESEVVQISWPKFQPDIQLMVKINAPDCIIHGNKNEIIIFSPKENSPEALFLLTPRKEGIISIVVKVFQVLDERLLGNTDVHTVAYTRAVGDIQIETTSCEITRPATIEPGDKVEWLEQRISYKYRRLQKLKEIEAIKGIDTQPHYLIEIEDIEQEIFLLKKQRGRLISTTSSPLE